ncbi:hypothetical protein [Caulobacter sp. FWC2]|uniref:hypothetical protein n=1 Tax=Caulobacter sp. FWC2 TaxID=69664 RepID=UPI001178896F|nr:hypothetical protein [Caulobacter sp. FWC2]
MREATFAEWFSLTAGGYNYIAQDGSEQTAAPNIPRQDWTNGVRQFKLNGSTTNLLLNSATLATQSVSTSGNIMTLSFYGTGTVTLSGAVTAAVTGTSATSRTTYSMATPGGSSITFTPSGTVTRAQFEAQAFASPYVGTGGGVVARPAEVAQMATVPTALLNRTTVTAVARMRPQFTVPEFPYRALIGTAGTYQRIGTSGANNSLAQAYDGKADLTATLGSGGAWMAGVGVACAWDAAGKSLCGNGGTVTSDTAIPHAWATSWYLGTGTAANTADGWYDEVVIYPFRASDAALAQIASKYP